MNRIFAAFFYGLIVMAIGALISICVHFFVESVPVFVSALFLFLLCFLVGLQSVGPK